MADRRGRRTVGIAQLLLVVAAGALWAATRLTWVVIRSFDGLGPPRDVSLSGASWSSALLPLALLDLATAAAALAVRGWPLRALAALVAVASFAVGYLGVSLWVVPDVAARGADLARVPLATLIGSGRQFWGAGLVVGAGVCTLIAAALLMRSASMFAAEPSGGTKYLSPGARRAAARQQDDQGDQDASSQETAHNPEPQLSERMIWDALDEGRDPTARPPDSDTEGR